MWVQGGVPPRGDRHTQEARLEAPGACGARCPVLRGPRGSGRMWVPGDSWGQDVSDSGRTPSTQEVGPGDPGRGQTVLSAAWA